MDKNKLILITGGARSGKSSFALREASKIPGAKAYIATAEAFDAEMRERIENHKKQRAKDWDTFEEPIKVVAVIKEIKGKYCSIIIDCLTLWLSNIMSVNTDVLDEIEKLVLTLRDASSLSHICVVSNEVGMGIVPDNELARRFRDMAGLSNQRIAEIADEVYLLVSGIPLKVKGKEML
jgi:adenosylcobinamide kinase / adenosylcobinamide-phosphate guanylyltransferase